jgi:adenylate kinase
MLLALTGTPGTGKSSLARRLADQGWDHVDLGTYVRDEGLVEGEDPARPGTAIVEPARVADEMELDLSAARDDEIDLVLDAHWSHEMPDLDAVAVLRCDPGVLEDRLRDRGWDEPKVHENAEAEAVGVVAARCRNRADAFELDTSDAPLGKVLERLQAALADPGSRHPPGTIDWIARNPDWF